LTAASVAVVALMIAVAAWVASAIPGDARLPVHWGLDGRPDAFAGKWNALLMPAAITATVSLMFYLLPRLEPRRESLERSQGLYLSGWGALLMFGLLIQLSVVAAALGWPVRSTSMMLAGLGIVFVVIGNQLGKSRSMYFIGFRTPWTLASEEVWVKTHRLAGKLMAAAGLLFLGAAFLTLSPGTVAALLFGAIAAAAGIPFVYSYLLWRREREDRRTRG
jgi:uncharacterized membrane protein